MKGGYWFSLRMFVLLALWALPVLFYAVVGSIALYQTGWFRWIVWVLPALWTLAWIVGKLWSPPRLQHAAHRKPIHAPEFWSPQDEAAISVVDQFRESVADVSSQSLPGMDRFLADASELARRLAAHYHAANGGGESDGFLNRLTLVEVLAVIHLAAEDLEDWTLRKVPGSELATIGQIGRVPGYINILDNLQKVAYLGSAILNPSRLLSYPLWRKSGRVTVEIQNELIRAFYGRYLRQVGYYMIEMYSGRLRGGSRNYREQFGRMASAVHAAGGSADALSSLRDVATTIAVMGQVKAGKSSLVNALVQENVAVTSVLPQTREVARIEFLLPGSSNKLTLLDTPGYSEASVTRRQQQEIETAAEIADIVLLVMAANVSAREPDVQIVRQLGEHYRTKSHLKPPTIIAVLTHIDFLRPVREWSPPYDWRHPTQLKEESIAAAVAYTKELFGEAIAGYACVYTGDVHDAPTSVADELVPQLLEHLDHGHSAAILKAFYQRLSRQRYEKLANQLIGLAKSVVLGRP